MGDKKSAAREAFKRRVKASLDRADEEFSGKYGEEIKGLLGLSRAEIDAIKPGTTDLETYNSLMEVVKAASRLNISQATLVEKIKSMGDVALSIARKVPPLAAML